MSVFRKLLSLCVAVLCVMSFTACSQSGSSASSFPTDYGFSVQLPESVQENIRYDLSNREVGSMGQNYLKSLFAVGFQGMLILVCVAIYAVLIQGIATGGDPIGAIWGCVGYTVLLCFCLFKTGSMANAVFGAH